MVLTKVISGGQIGVDIAGLRAAKALKLETGGFIPKGFKTQEGNKPDYFQMYNLIETSSPNYPERTNMNVLNSDGTVRIAKDFTSSGEIYTFNALKLYKKPFFDIQIFNESDKLSDCWFQLFNKWRFINNITVLNVAGNADRRIELIVQDFLERCFYHFKNYNY